MRELLVLEEQGSYTRAAEQLFITQSALSRHINAMEKELGVQLLNRNTHNLTFTLTGREVCKTFREIVSLYDHCIAGLSERSDIVFGSLRLGMLYHTINRDWGGILPAFRQKYPQIYIRTVSRQPREIFQALLDNSIDVGILPKADYLQNNLLCTKDSAHLPAVAMMRASHKLASETSLDLAQLASEPIILLNNDLCTTKSILEAFGRCDFIPAETIMSEYVDTVPFTIIEKDGVYICESGFMPSGYEGQLCTVPIRTSALYFEKAIAWRASNDNPAIPLLLDLV